MRRTCAQTASGTLLSQTVEDGFGRVIEETTPTTTGSITTRSEYNERGQLIRRTRTDGSTEQAPTLYEYDSMGRISRQITALCGTPTPENSAIVEYAYSAEPADDGLVYAVTRTTRYNAAGEALTSEEKTLLSALDPVLESASLRIDERGNATATRTEFAGGTARLTLTELPGCDTPARVLSIDGFTIEQTDAAGVTTRAARRYTATGTELTQTDGRGNTTTQVTDIAGRTLTLTDAAGATTTTTYAATSDQPATVTDALGNTARYRYDVRGRKVAEWGTAIQSPRGLGGGLDKHEVFAPKGRAPNGVGASQPALYAYDDADRLTSLTTFRAEGTSRTTDPSSRTDGDKTTWTYDDATGLELSKRYADGSTVTKTYDSFGNPATETNARGIVTSYEYDSFRNLLLAIRYSDSTEDETFAYNHLGQLTQVTDAAGTRSIAYKAPKGSEGDWTMREAGLPRRGERPMGWARINRYGEAETDSLLAGSMTHTITEQRDTLGRSTGYVYAKNDIPQQQTTIGYGADGRITSAGFTHQGEHKEFLYSYLPGTHLLHTLTHPNGLTLTQSYDATRDLPTQMDYSRADALVVQRAYTYDLLGRPTARDLARYGTQTSDTFGYNTRSELTSAHVNSADYSYAYDAIGNRTSATEAGTRTAYTANKLNQYTAEGSFRPTFDADGNQTLIKTSTGTWNVTYNAKNRPVRFEKADSSIVVECTYDTMGRRATKKVTTNGTLTEHRRFLYRGYLQIACCDLTRAYTPALWYILWDPTQPTATRPLAIQKNGTWYTYGWDLTKNICETYRTDARIDLAYTYTPYGEVSPAHTYDQPLRWSSEYHDVELGLVYYNYRHYNPAMGRWMGRDKNDDVSGMNLYHFVKNNAVTAIDYIGNEAYEFIPEPLCILNMVVKVKLNFIDELNITWDLIKKSQYKENLRDAIESTFNSNRFFLSSSNPCCPCHEGIWPSVSIEYVDSNVYFADWHLNVYAGVASNKILHPEVPPFRSESSSVGFGIFGAYGKLYADSYMRRASFSKSKHNPNEIIVTRDRQIPAVHEFGHALGLHHPGRNVVDSDGKKYIKNEPAEYRHIGYDQFGRYVNGKIDVMGEGMGLRNFYFDLWKDYLNNRHNECEYHF